MLAVLIEWSFHPFISPSLKLHDLEWFSRCFNRVSCLFALPLCPPLLTHFSRLSLYVGCGITSLRLLSRTKLSCTFCVSRFGASGFIRLLLAWMEAGLKIGGHCLWLLPLSLCLFFTVIELSLFALVQSWPVTTLVIVLLQSKVSADCILEYIHLFF